MLEGEEVMQASDTCVYQLMSFKIFPSKSSPGRVAQSVRASSSGLDLWSGHIQEVTNECRNK